MQRRLSALIILLFLISNISASCEEGQIDINKADANELDGLYGIGPVKAEAIMDARPFDSVDDLINVWGIGEATLTKIIEQGLACVSESNEEDEEAEEIQETNEEIIEEITEEITGEVIEDFNEEFEKMQGELITLNPKDIKTENSKEINKNNYAIYGFIGFCVLLVVLFLVRKKRYRKNGFR